jgi:hypothetical protein
MVSLLRSRRFVIMVDSTELTALATDSQRVVFSHEGLHCSARCVDSPLRAGTFVRVRLDVAAVRVVRDASFLEAREARARFRRCVAIVVSTDPVRAVRLRGDGAWPGAVRPARVLTTRAVALARWFHAREVGRCLLWDGTVDRPSNEALVSALHDSQAWGTPVRADVTTLAALRWSALHDAPSHTHAATRFDERAARTALTRAGAHLVAFRRSDRTCTIRWRFQSAQYTSLVREDGTVEQAGRCVNGEDRAFDFFSLVLAVSRGA